MKSRVKLIIDGKVDAVYDSIADMARAKGIPERHMRYILERGKPYKIEAVCKEAPPLEITPEQLDYVRHCIAVKTSIKCKGMHLTPEDREDLESKALQMALSKWHLYDPERSTWRTFANVTCKTCLIDALKWFYRYKWRLAPMPLLESMDPPDGRATDADAQLLLEELIEDAGQRQILWMRYQGVTINELMRQGYQPQEISRALEALREAIKERRG